jgi:predicted amidohydrolase
VTDRLPRKDLTLAAAAWPIERHASWDALADKLARWAGEAAEAGADIAVLPEYAGLEAAFIGPGRGLDTAGWCARAADAVPRYAALCATLAQDHGLTLLSGSLPADAGGALVNRACLCRPDGRVLPVDKQVLTPWERDHTPLAPGPALPVLAAPEGRIATLICYDAEFPPLARALAADILLVPSCTEAAHGATRVEVAARARALEGQGVAVLAPLLGAVPDCEIVDANTGTAAVFAPPDAPFPADGILARGAPDTPGWVVATLPAGVLDATRRHGAVTPRADMDVAEARARAATQGAGGSLLP